MSRSFGISLVAFQSPSAERDGTSRGFLETGRAEPGIILSRISAAPGLVRSAARRSLATTVTTITSTTITATTITTTTTTTNNNNNNNDNDKIW